MIAATTTRLLFGITLVLDLLSRSQCVKADDRDKKDEMMIYYSHAPSIQQEDGKKVPVSDKMVCFT